MNRMCLAADVPLVESGTAGYLGQATVIKKVCDLRCLDAKEGVGYCLEISVIIMALDYLEGGVLGWGFIVKHFVTLCKHEVHIIGCTVLVKIFQPYVVWYMFRKT